MTTRKRDVERRQPIGAKKDTAEKPNKKTVAERKCSCHESCVKPGIVRVGVNGWGIGRQWGGGSLKPPDVHGIPWVLPDREGIPWRLRDMPQWVSWNYVTRSWSSITERVFIEMPIMSWAGDCALVGCSGTGTPFDEAWEEFEEYDRAGVMVCLLPWDDLITIELKECVDRATGKVNRGAAALVDAVGSYTELTPDGGGLRIWTTGKTDDWESASMSPLSSVQIAQGGCYVPVTGMPYGPEPKPIRESQTDIERVVSMLRSGKSHAKYPDDFKWLARLVPLATRKSGRRKKDVGVVAPKGRSNPR